MAGATGPSGSRTPSATEPADAPAAAEGTPTPALGPPSAGPTSIGLGWRVGVVVFLGGIGGGLVFPILPILGVQLGIPAGLIGLILAANRITRLGTNPVTGQLIDRFGGKGPLAAGLLIEAISTFTYSVALGRHHPGLWLLLGRALWGIGSSFLIVGAVAAVLKASRFEDRGRVTSIVRSSQAIGMPAGLVVGGLIAGLWSDNAAFLSSAFLTLAAAGLTLILLPGGARGAVGHPDGGQASRREPPWAGFRGLAADSRLVTVWAVNFLIFLTLQGVLITTLVLVVDTRHLTLFGLHAEPTAGLLMAAMLGVSAAITVVVGRLLDRLGRRTGLVLPGLAGLVGGFAILAVARSLVPMLAGLAILGAAMGATSLPLLALMGDLVPAALRGRAVGLYQTFGDAGGSLGPLVGVWAGLHAGFEVTYLAIAAVVAAAAPLVLRLWRTESADRS